MKRQAVVIIHGIGEQRPMSTLRGFVKSILAIERSVLKLNAQREDHWVMPDSISENYELRKITAKSNSQRGTTDFYEYYWASNMRDTNLGHVIPWFKTLLFRNPVNIPKRIRPIWLCSWVLLLLTFYFILSGFVDELQIQLQILNPTITSLLPVIGSLISIIMQFVVIQFVGDAARYLTPNPGNIEERRKIRKNGIDLIRKLHVSNRNYERIVIVGHSLGSVIGYDIISHLWDEYRRKINVPEGYESVVLDGKEYIQPELYKMQNRLKDTTIHDFRKLQKKVLFEQRALGNDWLITDFITLGSPLAHAKFLLAENETDFFARVEDRELPICPPITDNNNLFSYQNYSYKGEKRNLWYLHHAAPFACTRWTNLYYPGDLVGGPLSPSFGDGVMDVKLSFTKSKWMQYLPTSHVKYWVDNFKEGGIIDRKESKALTEIYKHMDFAFFSNKG